MNDFLDFEAALLQEEFDHLENQIQEIEYARKAYTIRPRLDPMQVYNENEFRRRFRLPKDTVRFLYNLIGAELEPKVERPGFTISGMDKILITLRYYATASYHMVSGDFYGVSESSVCRIVPRVSDMIAALRERFIQMPTTAAEIEENKRDFFNVAGMPSIIGAVDGTLIKIQEVGGAVNKTLFFSRKQIYAVNTQVICDSNGKILDIVARWPGSAHDQTVFSHSRIFERFLTGVFQINQRPALLLADGGYSAEPFLAIPLRATNELNRLSERLYQRSHSRSRNVVERVMGQWKKRFPCLWIGMRFRKLDSVLNVIVATAVLHNICKMRNEEEPPLLSREQERAYEAAVRRELTFQNELRNRQRIPNTISNQFLKAYFENVAGEQ